MQQPCTKVTRHCYAQVMSVCLQMLQAGRSLYYLEAQPVAAIGIRAKNWGSFVANPIHR